MKKNLLNKLKDSLLIADGAMGTEITRRFPQLKSAPDILNIENPQLIESIHKDYINAGAQLIQTNTFGSSRIKLSAYNLSDKIKKINEQAVKIAFNAVKNSNKKDVIILGDIGPTGKFSQPYGPLSFEELYENFYEQAQILKSAGIDSFIIETMSDLQEARAALLAVKTVSPNSFIICQMTFEKTGRTITGTDPITAAVVLDKLGADIIGVNCSTGPEGMKEIVRLFSENTKKPVSAQPNAGIPALKNGITTFPMGPEEFSNKMVDIVQSGANLIGGCCGTTPLHIKLLKEKFKKYKPVKNLLKKDNVIISSRSKILKIGENLPVRIIGERINPTANKKLAEDLLKESMIELKNTALEQISAGADSLDINLGNPSIDEKKIMQIAILTLQELVQVPLVIDSSNPDVIETALRVYAGRALVNSVNAKKESLEKILPVAKKYGAAIILLPVGEKGIPETAEERIKLLKILLERAEQEGFDKTDMLADGLVLSVATGQTFIIETLKTIQIAKKDLNLSTILGISNVSFGMPERVSINAAFLAMACAAGLDAAIINPLSEFVKKSLYASSVLTNRDKNSHIFINLYSKKENPSVAEKTSPLQNSIIKGLKEEAKIITEKLISENFSANEILNTMLIPAMQQVGDNYENGIFFLPQLILAAEAMQESLKIIKPYLKNLENSSNIKGKLVIATVKGDVHDIGKNIVSLMLSNDGWEVHDLGKDIDNEKILKEAKTIGADIICLSALMTTTMVEMTEMSKLIKKYNLPYKLLIGGAAVTARFAKDIGAFYAPDAFSAVKVARKIIEKDKNET